jgi:outer membrane protein TolC
MKKNNWLVVLLLGISQMLHAQDSLTVLNSEQLLLLVKKYHPVARQAQIGVIQADANITLARGAFNPIIGGYLAQKNFTQIEYYNLTSAEIKIPTWYGIELGAGIQDLTGQLLNPNETGGRTNFAGISVPLAKNLVIDKRRAFLRQAKLYQTMAKAEQRALLNDVLMGAMEQYWQWVNAYQAYMVMSNNVNVNQTRLQLIKKAYQNGERPAIDTIEAITQLQSFEYRKNQYLLEFQNSGLELSAYLWKTNNEPYYLPENIIPQGGWENETNLSNFNLVLNDLLSVAESSNPTLLQYKGKVDIMKIEKKLKFQELLPKLDVQYNHLNKDYAWNTEGLLLNNNYQYGVKFEMPLFLSEGRGAYKAAKFKLESSKLDLNIKQQQVEIKVKQYYNEYITLKKQIELQSAAYNNYNQLLKAEETRFFNGESSLFLINSRESKALEAQEKLIELKTKFFKTLYGLQWSAGLLQ